MYLRPVPHRQEIVIVNSARSKASSDPAQGRRPGTAMPLPVQYASQTLGGKMQDERRRRRAHIAANPDVAVCQDIAAVWLCRTRVSTRLTLVANEAAPVRLPRRRRRCVVVDRSRGTSHSRVGPARVADRLVSDTVRVALTSPRKQRHVTTSASQRGRRPASGTLHKKQESFGRRRKVI